MQAIESDSAARHYPSAFLSVLLSPTTALLACLLLFGAPLHAQDAPPTEQTSQPTLTALELIDQALERTRGLSSYADLSMVVHRPTFEKSSTLKSWTRGDEDALIRFTGPAKQKGDGTLKKGPQMWTYTPKLNRVIRLPTSLMSQSWGGSDFSYNDLSRSDELRVHFEHEITHIEEITGEAGNTHRLYTITSTPHQDAPVVWGKQELKIRDDLVVLEQTFFDQDFKPLKQMIGSDIRDAGDGRIVAMRLRMTSLEDEDNWTEVVYEKFDFDIELKDRLFTQFSLKNP